MLGEKGGTGETTFATNLAGMRAAAGRDVLILDADRQGSASYWAEKRDGRNSGLPVVHSVQKFGTGLLQAVKDMARRYDDIVIDAGGADSREVEAALRVADRAVIPIQPAGLDVWTLGLIDDRIGEAKAFNDQLQAFVILNRVSANPRDIDADEAREAIVGCENLTLATCAVCDRVAIKRAAPVGLTVAEYKPHDAKASQEMAQLYELVFAEKQG
jgi:chromosome partitioning protein